MCERETQVNIGKIEQYDSERRNICANQLHWKFAGHTPGSAHTTEQRMTPARRTST
jgi:hypothetical protein